MKNQTIKIVKSKTKENNIRFKKNKKWHYSIITILLVIFLAQLIWGVIINSAKIYTLNFQKNKLEKINKIATQKNLQLREELKKYSSNSGIEALARNRLQFSQKDETLIIIKDIQE